MELDDFFAMQRRLAQAKGWTDQRTPEHAPFSLLWSVEELGEVIAVIKKKGGGAIMENESVRAHFLEECADVLMYLFDAMISYGVTADELEHAYAAKFHRNMSRDWRENDALYETSPWSLVIVERPTSDSPEERQKREAELLLRMELHEKNGIPLAVVGWETGEPPLSDVYEGKLLWEGYGEDLTALFQMAAGAPAALEKARSLEPSDSPRPDPSRTLVYAASEEGRAAALALGFTVL